MAGKLKHIYVDILDMNKEVKELSRIDDYKLGDIAMKSQPAQEKRCGQIPSNSSNARTHH